MTVTSSAHSLFGLSTDTKPTDVPIDRLFFETDTLQQFYFNGAVWQQLPGGLSGLNPNSTILEHSTTLSDYTTPTDASATSSAGSDIAFSDDYSSNVGWTQSGAGGTITVNSGVVGAGAAINTLSSNNDRVSKALGVTLSDTEWVLDIDFVVQANTGTNGSDGGAVLLTAGSALVSTTQDMIGIKTTQLSAGSSTLSIYYKDGAGAITSASPSTSFLTNTQKYLRLIRMTATSVVLEIYDDALRTNLFDTVTQNSLPATVTGLTHIQHSEVTGGVDRFYYTVDNVAVYNNTTLPILDTSGNAIDGNTTTFWESDPGINESITLDMGSVVNNFSLAYYIDKVQTDITETQIQIIDDTTGDILRTVNVSDLVDQTYNYIRFNGVNTQFIKIEGSSGNSLVMAANELEVLVETDPPLTTLHGQYTINGTDDTLPLDGGDPTTSLIDDPQVNNILFNNVLTPNDPALEKGLMWVETTDVDNNSLKVKLKSSGSIQEFEIAPSGTGGGITGLNPNSTILEYLEDETLYTLPTSAFASSDDGNPPDDAIDDNTGTFWRSNAEVNPEIALNMGSLVNCYGLAYYLASGIGNTETQFEILSGDGGASPTFVDNFVYVDQPTADAAWPSNDTAASRVNIANQDMDVTLTANSSNDSIVHDLQDELGAGVFLDTTFIVRFKMTIVAEVQSNQHASWIGISNMNETADPTTVMNFVGIVINNQLAVQNYSSRNSLGASMIGGTNGGANSVAWTASQVDFWEITQSGGTSTVNRYPDDTYTTPTDSSSQSTAIGSDLRYIKFQNNPGGTGGTFTVTIDDVVVNNGSLTIPTPTFPTNVIRTVNFSELTEDAWNFIRFNGVNAQVIGVRGSSGNSLVMAANELRVQIEDDPPLTTLHGQFTINPTNASLPLNGGDPTSSVIDDPATNSMTLNSTVEQSDPATDAMVMWQEILDANNSVSHSKMKINGSVQNVRWF